MKRTETLVVLALTVAAGFHAQSMACTVMSVRGPRQIVRTANLIVRDTAVHYVKPHTGDVWTTGVPKSTVGFDVLEVLRGRLKGDEILLHAYLSHENDFNDHPVPYTFVRRNGRRGSCYANTYRKGAQFLLFLQAREEGLAMNWCAPRPVNEQITGELDRWLLWVRADLAGAVSDMARGAYR
jgi:hypothetical protein